MSVSRRSHADRVVRASYGKQLSAKVARGILELCRLCFPRRGNHRLTLPAGSAGQLFDVAPPALVLPALEVLPVSLDEHVGFQLQVRFGGDDAVPDAGTGELGDEQRVGSLSLQVGSNSAEIEVDVLRVSERSQDVDDAEGKQPPFCFLQGARE